MARNSALTVKVGARSGGYDIRIDGGILPDAGEWASSAAPGARRVVVISNKKVFGLYGRTLETSLAKSGFSVRIHLIGDGERFKNIRTLEKALDALNEAGISRTDLVIALGGGVVGDLAGFAAAVHLRGIRFLQVPTTLLAMIDSSVGGKTGINSSFGKNLIGAFHQPAGVLIDPDVLKTLDGRELTSGFCEAIKQGAISGRRLFDNVSGFLKGNEAVRAKIDSRPGELAELIAAQVAFKAKIVAGDERERADKRSKSSRKILNFGHTFAHALEKATNYRYFRHGEAVGHGILFAAELSKRLELLGGDDIKLLNDVVQRAGNLPPLAGIDREKVFSAFSQDKKVIGDSLQWIVLRGIGKPLVIPGSEIPPRAVRETLNKFIQQ